MKYHFFIKLSKFKCHHSKRSEVINIFLFLLGEQRQRKNKTATNQGPVSRKSRGNFPGTESCFVIAVFTFKITEHFSKFENGTIKLSVNEAELTGL